MTMREATVLAPVGLQDVVVNESAQRRANFAANGAADDAAQGRRSKARHHGADGAGDCADRHAKPGRTQNAGDASRCPSDATDGPAYAAGQVAVATILLVAVGADGGQRPGSTVEELEVAHCVYREVG